MYSFVTHSRTGDYTVVQPKEVLIVEGILVLTSKELLKEFDLKVYVQTDSDERLIRRIEGIRRSGAGIWRRFCKGTRLP